MRTKVTGSGRFAGRFLHTQLGVIAIQPQPYRNPDIFPNPIFFSSPYIPCPNAAKLRGSEICRPPSVPLSQASSNTPRDEVKLLPNTIKGRVVFKVPSVRAQGFEEKPRSPSPTTKATRLWRKRKIRNILQKQPSKSPSATTAVRERSPKRARFTGKSRSLQLPGVILFLVDAHYKRA